MCLGQIFTSETIIANLESEGKDELLEEMVVKMGEFHPDLDRNEALTALIEREQKMSTGILPSVAIPHAMCPSVKGVCGAIGLSKKGIDFDSIDGKPVHLVFMILTSPDDLGANVEVLKLLETLLLNSNFIQNIEKCETSGQVYDLLKKTEMSLS